MRIPKSQQPILTPSLSAELPSVTHISQTMQDYTRDIQHALET